MNGWKLALLLFAGLIVLGGVITGITIGAKACSVADKVTDPDRIVYTYEWFFNTRASILTYFDQLKVARQTVETFKTDHVKNLDNYVNSTELSRLQSVAQGIENNLISTCNFYNANALNLTRGIFKDWRLPLEINYKNGELKEVYQEE